MKGDRVVVPQAMRADMLKQVHRSHLGVEKCKQRVNDVLFWPGMSAEIVEMCERCSTCAETRCKNMKEPMVLSQQPEKPWQKVATDLFHFEGNNYVLVADYYSKFVEFAKLLQDLSSGTVIKFLKDQFARYGIPEQVVSENGPQYACKEFSDFARSYGFEHVTSSPRYPQSNGFAESQVKIVKRILKKCSVSKTDVALAVIEWRNTPTDGLRYSPAQSFARSKTEINDSNYSKSAESQTNHGQAHYST